jgi:hypothetical protein
VNLTGRFQRTALVEAFFLGGGVFLVALLLFEPHLAEPQPFFLLWPDALAKAGKRKCLDIHREGTWQNRISLLVLAILSIVIGLYSETTN